MTMTQLELTESGFAITLAELLVSTAELRASSWDAEKKVYNLSINDAAMLLVTSSWTSVVSLLLTYSWDESLEWAGNTLGRTQESRVM